jgi:hypothetical protein
MEATGSNQYPTGGIEGNPIGYQRNGSRRPGSTNLPAISVNSLQCSNRTWMEPVLRGRISSHWKNAFSDDDSAANCKKHSKWAGQLVSHLLNYSQQLWIFRCGVVHGHTKEEHRQWNKEDLQNHIRAAYDEYEHDPFCIPHDWRRLFSRPVDLLLTLDRGSLMCWLRSFSKARQLQALAISRQKCNAKKFFLPIAQAQSAHSRLPSTSDSPSVDSNSVEFDDTASVTSGSSDSYDSDVSEDSDLDSVSSIINYDPFSKTALSSAVGDTDLVDELDTG